MKNNFLFSWLRFAILLNLLFGINCCIFSQNLAKKKKGLWQITDVKSLRNNMGILSTEILREERKRTRNLQKLIGHTLYYKDSTVFFENSIQRTLSSTDTIYFYKTIKYRIVADDRSTLKYPGDELSDTSNDNRTIGKSFIRLLGLAKSNYLKVRIGENPKDKLSVYRLCKISQDKVALALLDQDILLICKRSSSLIPSVKRKAISTHP